MVHCPPLYIVPLFLILADPAIKAVENHYEKSTKLKAKENHYEDSEKSKVTLSEHSEKSEVSELKLAIL